MKTNKKIQYYILLLFLKLFIGCANIPTSEYPVETKREFNASFERTWDAVKDVIKLYEGTIITMDNPSGLIVYSINKNNADSKTFQIYMNVFIKNQPTINKTIVYLVPRCKNGAYPEEIDIDFFDRLEKIL